MLRRQVLACTSLLFSLSLIPGAAQGKKKGVVARDERTGIAVEFQWTMKGDRTYWVSGKCFNESTSDYSDVLAEFAALDKDGDRLTTIFVTLGSLASNGKVPFSEEWTDPVATGKYRPAKMVFIGAKVGRGDTPAKPDPATSEGRTAPPGITEERTKDGTTICRDPSTGITVEFQWGRYRTDPGYWVRGKVRNESDTDYDTLTVYLLALARDGDKMGDRILYYRSFLRGEYVRFDNQIVDHHAANGDRLRKVTLLRVEATRK